MLANTPLAEIAKGDDLAAGVVGEASFRRSHPYFITPFMEHAI